MTDNGIDAGASPLSASELQGLLRRESTEKLPLKLRPRTATFSHILASGKLSSKRQIQAISLGKLAAPSLRDSSFTAWRKLILVGKPR